MRLPIRIRLTLAFSAAMAVILLVLGAFVYIRLGADLLDSVDLGLRPRAQTLVAAVKAADPQSLGDATGQLIDPDEAFAQVLARDGRIEDASSGVVGAPLLTRAEVASIHEPTFLTRLTDGFDDPNRLLAVPVEGPSGATVVVVGSTLGDMNDALGQLTVILATVGPAALVLTAIAGWILAGAALRPVERMRREAAAISASEPARRLPDPGTADELARLAATLNSMLDRLQESLERERRFVDDASHELRTPLATLRAEIELARARGRSVPELEAALDSAREDVDRLQRLTDDLLVLARSRGGRVPLRREPTPLVGVVEQAVRSVGGLASTAEVTIRSETPDETVDLDPDRVEGALRNLLENAIRHSPKGGQVAIMATVLGDRVRFVVEDPGPGFQGDLLGRAFEPFSRGPNETVGDAGTGLGLAIVRAVAEAHGGSATAENMVGGGARVILDLRV